MSNKAPVLAWHREAAKEIHAAQYATDNFDFAAIIAAHDQHAETVRLLEAVLNVAENCDETGYADGVGFVNLDKLHNEIRTHLAKLKGTQ